MADFNLLRVVNRYINSARSKPLPTTPKIMGILIECVPLLDDVTTAGGLKIAGASAGVGGLKKLYSS
jgi:hypothetical protein